MGIPRGQTLALDKKFRVRDLAYTAGMLDGEGCITAVRPRKGHGTQVIVYICSSHMPVLDWLQETYGGGCRYWNGVKNKKWKRVEKWIVPARSVTPFLKLMVPFLKIKQPQAYQAMAIRHMVEVKKDPERICRAIDKLQDMNQGRYGPPE